MTYENKYTVYPAKGHRAEDVEKETISEFGVGEEITAERRHPHLGRRRDSEEEKGTPSRGLEKRIHGR